MEPIPEVHQFKGRIPKRTETWGENSRFNATRISPWSLAMAKIKYGAVLLNEMKKGVLVRVLAYPSTLAKTVSRTILRFNAERIMNENFSNADVTIIARQQEGKVKMKVYLSRQMSNDSIIVYFQADGGLCAIVCDGHQEYQAQQYIQDKGHKVLIEEEKLCHATGCNNPFPPFKCSRCRRARYCNASCQQTHWAEHKCFCC